MAVTVSGLIKPSIIFFEVIYRCEIFYRSQNQKLPLPFSRIHPHSFFQTLPISVLCGVQMSLLLFVWASASEKNTSVPSTWWCNPSGTAASRPLHRWQCCTSKSQINPVNPVPHKLWHTHFDLMESHWINAVIDLCVFLVFFFCLLCATKICACKKTKIKVNIELGHIELGLMSAPSHLRRALLKISQYRCQSADQLVNEVSFLECFSLSRASKWRKSEALKHRTKHTDGWA